MYAGVLPRRIYVDPHLLGLIAYPVDQYGSAVELIRRAIAHDGQNARYFSDLGAALKEQRQRARAMNVQGLRRATFRP